jgi:hypothetical protein
MLSTQAVTAPKSKVEQESQMMKDGQHLLSDVIAMNVWSYESIMQWH